MANDEFREQQEALREFGVARRNETRHERAIRRQVAEEIAAAVEVEQNRHGRPREWEALRMAASIARDIGGPSSEKQPREKRPPCPTMCPCICHDGFGGAHPNRKCSDLSDDEK